MSGTISEMVDAIAKLGDIGGTNVETHLINRLSDHNQASIRIAVVDALSRSGSPAAVDLFRRFASDDGDRFVRVEAALALRQLAPTHGVAATAFDLIMAAEEMRELIGGSGVG